MRISLLFAAILASVWLPAHAQEANIVWFSFEPDIVTLEGYLETKKYQGPPNYEGRPEKDQFETALIVTLSKTISVRRRDNDPVNGEDVLNVSEVQLICADRQTGCGNYLGKNVRVFGSLFTAHTGHHHAKILMEVREISAP